MQKEIRGISDCCPLEIGQQYELNIDGISSEGQGIGRYSGIAVFVPLALPGERVLARVKRIKKNYAEAELMHILSVSPYRERPACEVFGRCGACSLMHMCYETQLEVKRMLVRDALERIGGFKNISVNPTMGMDKPLRYRNKAVFPFGNVQGKVVFGCYERKSHRLVETQDCLLQSETAIGVMKAICAWANEFGVKAYEQRIYGNDYDGVKPGQKNGKGHIKRQTKKELKEREGILRYGIIRITSEGVMVMVVTSGALPYEKELIERLRMAESRLASIQHNINLRNDNLIMGEKSRLIYGRKTIQEELDGLSFDVSAESFLQVNPSQTLRLYNTVVSGLELTKKDSVLDLYCGIGTISLLMAQKAGHVLGVEVVQAAIEDAKRNAKRNGIDNVEFICGSVEDFLKDDKKTMNSGSYSTDSCERNPLTYLSKYVKINSTDQTEVSPNAITAIVMDPPRKGTEPQAIEAIIASGIPKLAYVSCNPATLARDCKQLSAGGYEITYVQPVDMFPETEHVETVCLLVLRNHVTHINIDVDVEELVQDKRGQATYPQIKKYVLEQTGLKVSSLYISQIKRKCGLEVGDSYNKPKSEDAHVPQCPPEKEAAIMDALRHFGMIS